MLFNNGHGFCGLTRTISKFSFNCFLGKNVKSIFNIETLTREYKHVMKKNKTKQKHRHMIELTNRSLTYNAKIGLGKYI